ncbi:unnamed protein product [Ectocarpus fasciculatus]
MKGDRDGCPLRMQYVTRNRMNPKLVYAWSCIMASVLDVSCTLSGLCTIRDVSDAPAGITPKQGHAGRVRYFPHLPSFTAIAFFSVSSKTQPLLSVVHREVYSVVQKLYQYVRPRYQIRPFLSTYDHA